MATAQLLRILSFAATYFRMKKGFFYTVNKRPIQLRVWLTNQ